MLGVQAICFGRFAPDAAVRIMAGQSALSADREGFSRDGVGRVDWLGGAAKSVIENAILANAVMRVLVFMEERFEGWDRMLCSVSY